MGARFSIRGHRDVVYCALFGRCGSRLATGSDDCLVKVWDARTGRLLATCRGHASEITDLACSRDDALLASASDQEGYIRTWGFGQGQHPPSPHPSPPRGCCPVGHPVAVLSGHTGSVSNLAFCESRDALLLSCGFDGTVRVWNAAASGPALFVVRRACLPFPSLVGWLGSLPCPALMGTHA